MMGIVLFLCGVSISSSCCFAYEQYLETKEIKEKLKQYEKRVENEQN